MRTTQDNPVLRVWRSFMMVKEVTPEELRCAPFGVCPAVFEVTPEEVRCGIGACPSVFDSGNQYMVVGVVPTGEIPLEVRSKIGKGEAVVLVPKKLLDLFNK